MIARQHWLSCSQCMVLQNVENRALQHQCRGHGFKSHWSGGGRVLPYITYTGMCRPMGLWFWSSWYRTGYPFKRHFLEWGVIFQTHESSSFVSSHLKLFKDQLLLKIRFNALTIKLLYSWCTLCFSMQGERILVLAASADSAILDK